MHPTMEEIFALWMAWDLESDPAQKARLKEILNANIDAYKADNDMHCSRALFKFYARRDYAKWRIKQAKLGS